jgi:hypothetical protein
MMATRCLLASGAYSALHQGGTTSGALPTLPAPFRQLSEGLRAISASIKTTNFGSGQEVNQSGSERQRQLFWYLHAQRRNFTSDPCEGTGADPISSEWIRLRPCGKVVLCTRGSASAARDGAGAALVATKRGGVGFGRLKGEGQNQYFPTFCFPTFLFRG